MSVKAGDKVWVSSRWNDLPEYSETERLIQEADILGLRTNCHARRKRRRRRLNKQAQG